VVLRIAGYIWLGIHLGDTPFLLSLICFLGCNRAKAVYTTEHCFCFNASFPERECTLSSLSAASLEFTQSSFQRVYVFDVFDVFLCICELDGIKRYKLQKKPLLSLSTPRDSLALFE